MERVSARFLRRPASLKATERASPGGKLRAYSSAASAASSASLLSSFDISTLHNHKTTKPRRSIVLPLSNRDGRPHSAPSLSDKRGAYLSSVQFRFPQPMQR